MRQYTEHYLFLHPDPPHFLSYSVPEQKGEIICEGLCLVILQFVVHISGSLGDCSSTHLLPKELPRFAPEPPRTYPLEEKPTDSSIYIPATPFILVKELKFNRLFCQPWHLQGFQEAIAGNQVPEIMASTVPLPLGASLPSINERGASSTEVPSFLLWSGRWDSNPRQPAWEALARKGGNPLSPL